MTWTYTPDFTGNRDPIRVRIGDTNSADPIFSDEEIAYAYAQAGSLDAAAVVLCEWAEAKYAKVPDSTFGPSSVSGSQRAKAFRALRLTLQRKLAVGVATPFAGGISEASKESYEGNSDRVQPAFTKNLHDNPGLPTTEDRN